MTGIDEGEVVRRLRERGIQAEWRGEPPAGYGGLCTDSREATEGDLFVAVAGTDLDGHDYVADAGAAGARAAVVEHPVAAGGLPQLVVTDSRAAAAHLASLFHGDPGAEMQLVGVTGTNGKTTVTWIARHVLSDAAPTGAVGSLGVTDPDGTLRPGELTTPGPVRLHRLLRELRDRGAGAVVLEVSSHALDQDRAAALALDVGVFTTLSREHLEYHGDMDDYRRAKLRLADRVRPSGACVVNADEPAWDSAGFSGRRLIRYGLSSDAAVRATDLEFDPRETRFRLEVDGGPGPLPVRLGLLGDFNVGNAVAAAATGVELGVPPDRVAALLSRVPQVPGRLERLRDRPPVVVRDFAHTPDAMERAIGAVRRVTDGRILVVFGAGGERDRGKRPLMGDVAARSADRAWVTNDNPRGEDPERIARDVAEGMPEELREIVLDRREAIRRAMLDAGPGDVVLLLGKGHETHLVIDGEKIPFDEEEVVEELSRQMGLPGSRADRKGDEAAGAGTGGPTGRSS